MKTVDQFGSLLKSTDPVLVDFSAVYASLTIVYTWLLIVHRWCGPCKMLTPVLEEAATKHPNIHFVKVDIDMLPSLASQFNVSQS